MSEYIGDLYVKSREMADELARLATILHERDAQIEQQQARIAELEGKKHESS